ncbi:GNAT family N-acetyltransferase [Limoniibacter endophyticus]|uniref:N-acetyltransferase GCN5 n=1 Tax=Limoniibacter endophyticus TaxID=1565040 RepID=A0A8J3DI72_9HYPH|nr:GNAT family N-acetyltransferase [Limoniibacter endophyticus]GHC73929.1 N-acetyltransferase GCN5 [Limoniibacter endophyticus]
MTTLSADIRKAGPRDADAIAAVHHASWKNAYSGIIPYAALIRMLSRRRADWWRNAITRSASILVLEINGDVVGYATIGANRAKELPQDGEIYEIYLLPEYQGIGLGSRLFNAARKSLEDHGFCGLVVWALEENRNALEFYVRQGGKDAAEGVEIFDQRALRKLAFTWD